LLILDEPTAVLAPAEARELLEWLRNFAAEGGTAIVITHKLDEARAYADDLTVLRRGRTVLTRAASETSTEDLATAMIGAGPPATHVATGNRTIGSSAAAARGVSIPRERGLAAIHDATFDIHRGEIVGVAGVEGSGHHELLLALAGRLPVSRGELLLPDDIGFVPEDRHRDAVVLDFTLTENVAINGAGARSGRMHWPARVELTRSQLTAFDVRSRGPADRMAALSGGNQQKVVLAREVSGKPTLLVLENPTRGLDIRAAAFVREQIQTIRAGGAAVVFYSSDLDEIIDIADRVLVVHAGRVRSVETDRALVGAAMLGAG
jgi:ABC-type uncharacterized transport system ATPase subunit